MQLRKKWNNFREIVLRVLADRKATNERQSSGGANAELWAGRGFLRLFSTEQGLRDCVKWRERHFFTDRVVKIR